MNDVEIPDVLSFRGFVQSIFRHKLIVLLTFVVVLGLVSAYTVFRGRDFESTSKLFIRKGRETVSIDPIAEAATGQVISVTDTQDREINSVVSILMNRDLLEQVVDDVGVDTILDGLKDGPENADSPIKSALVGARSFVVESMREMGLLETLTRREEAIGSLRESLKVDATDLSAVVKVAVVADSPKLAQLLNKKVIDAFRTYHARANSSTGSLEFFDSQAKRLEEQLKTASRKLADKKIEYDVVSLDVKKEMLEQKMLSIDDLLMRAETGLAASSSKITELDRQLEQEASLVQSSAVEGMANTARAAMRDRLFELQILESERLTRYSPEHPKVREIRDQIKQVQSIFENEAEQVQVTSSVNEVQQQLRISLLIEKATVASLSAQIDALKSQRQALKEEIEALNACEFDLIELQRQVDVLDINYRQYIENLEQVRIVKELEDQSISNINVVQQPSFVETPIGPNNMTMYAIGFIIAICASFGVAVLCELYWPSRLRDVAPVQAAPASVAPARNG
ncbi:MAG: GumC family protein, partial [Pirellulaceae bacterium]